MAQAHVRQASYDDLRRAPDHLVAELIAGELHTTPRPTPRHAHAYSALGIEVGAPFHQGRGGPGGWWILDEPELHFRADVLVPDLTGWRRERLPALPEEAFFTQAPDWICEILSPSTERIDRLKKLRIYAREGVRHAWLVNPRRAHAGSAAPGRRALDLARHPWRGRSRARRTVRRHRNSVGAPVARS